MPPPPEGFSSRFLLGPALRTQPDRRLVTLVREGYEAAFEEIVRRYGRPLAGYAASIVGSRSEDVTQDAFSKALPALRRDDAEIELRPWLFRIVRNTAFNDLRDSPPSPEVLAEAPAGGSNPAEELERREELADLMRRLQALPEAQRAAIVMRELEGLSHEEIAAALGLSGGAVRQAIYRARQALRNGLGMLVPLPLMQSMLATAASSGAAETAAGTVAVGGAAGAGAGVGMALKATTATVLVAGAVGVALKHDDRSGNAEAAPVHASQAPVDEPTPGALAGESDDRGDGSSDDDGHGRHRGHGGPGDGDRGGHDEAEPGDGGGSDSGPGGSGSGPGGDDLGSSGPGGDPSDSGASGPGSGDDLSGGGSGSGDEPSFDEGSTESSSGSGSADEIEPAD